MKFNKRIPLFALAALLLATCSIFPSAKAVGSEVDYVQVDMGPDPAYGIAYDDFSTKNSALPLLRVEGGVEIGGYVYPKNIYMNYSNQWGEWLFPLERCWTAGAFSEGWAFVKTERICGYVDQTGALVLPLPSEINGGEFHEGIATIFNFEGRPLRVIDTEGKTVFTCDQFSEIGSFYNGVAVARDLMGKYGLIDKTGVWIVAPQYDYMSDPRGNTVIVNLGDYDGVIDLEGNEIIPCTYDDISYQDSYTDGVCTSDEHPLFLLSTEENLEGLADENGTILIQPQDRFNLTGDFSDGVCRAIYYPYTDKPIPLEDPIPKGLVSLSGQELTGPAYEETLPGSEGLIPVRDLGDDQWKFVNTRGQTELTLPQDAQVVRGFQHGLAQILLPDGQSYFMDRQGKMVYGPLPISPGDSYMSVISIEFSDGVAWGDEVNNKMDLIFDPRLRDYTSPWAEGEMEQAKAAGLVTESNDSYFTFRITRRRFAELAANLVEQVTGQTITPAAEGTFTDTDDLWVRKAAAIGLVNGLDDGSRFSPNGYISREQLATMLYRAVRYIESQTGTTILTEQGSLSGYTDAAQVSPWAQEAMAALHAAGILKGTSGTTLSPKDTTTVEQGILLTLRAYEMAAGE